MGYSTDFTGKFNFNKPLTKKLYDQLNGLANTRRMARKVGKEYGVEGEFYFEGKGFAGQDHDDTIIDFNRPPRTQPGLWCHWAPTEDRKHLEWNGSEKFYNYIEWLDYIIKNFLAPNGFTISGDVSWQGEDMRDRGVIVVFDNKIKFSKLK